MSVIHFPPPERYSHRRKISAIPTGYRYRATVALEPAPLRRVLSQWWVAVIVATLVWFAINLASASPLTLAQFAAPASNAGSAAAPASAPVQQTAQPQDDIRDIRGPVHIAPSWLWLAYTAGTLALAAAVYALYKWLKKRAKERAKLPHEIAIEALEKARSLMSVEKMREYSFAVSEITRNYIESRFGARAAHRTTEEFLHDLVEKPSGGLAEHSDLLNEFLKHCDLVKFARWTLTADEMEKMHNSAITFVMQTRPQTEANPSQPKAAAAPKLEDYTAASS